MMMEVDNRPDSRQLLKKVKDEEIYLKRGKLKVFFGYAAGVGKTYSMLQEAHELKRNNIDVVVGYIERHTRKDTLALIDGLEVLPTRKVEYKGKGNRCQKQRFFQNMSNVFHFSMIKVRIWFFVSSVLRRLCSLQWSMLLKVLLGHPIRRVRFLCPRLPSSANSV